MERNGYGWLTDDDCGDQKAGFYVDSGNRILYWPTKKGNGYVLDEGMARVFLDEISFKGDCFQLTFFLFAIPASIIWKVVPDSNVYGPVLCFFIPIILLRILEEIRTPSSKIECDNRSLETIRLCLPKPEHLKMSDKLGRKEFWLSMTFLGLVSLALFVYAVLELFSGQSGDFYLFGSTAIVLFSFVVLVLKREAKGVELNSVKFYAVRKNTKDEDDGENISIADFIQRYVSYEWSIFKGNWKVILLVLGTVFTVYFFMKS